jgi:hypothetical protein
MIYVCIYFIFSKKPRQIHFPHFISVLVLLCWVANSPSNPCSIMKMSAFGIWWWFMQADGAGWRYPLPTRQGISPSSRRDIQRGIIMWVSLFRVFFLKVVVISPLSWKVHANGIGRWPGGKPIFTLSAFAVIVNFTTLVAQLLSLNR